MTSFVRPFPSDRSSAVAAHRSSVKIHELQDDAAARFVERLARLHPVKPAAEIAHLAGVSHETARRWLDGQAAPAFGPTLKLIGAHGLDLLPEVFRAPPPWLDEARARAAFDAAGADLFALQARIARIAAAFEA
jgi:hypothetical protein